MNHYEQFLSEFLSEHKEVSLEKIGVIKTTGVHADGETGVMPVDFKYDKRAVTSPELIDFISAKTKKSRMLIASDIESHFAQAKEFINIGKTYEIINAGFIKKINSGEYELIPYSQALKAQKNFSQPLTKQKQRKKRGASIIQIFTLLIVLAILGGLGWEAYQFFLKSPAQITPATEVENTTADSTIKSDSGISKNAIADTVTSPIITTQSIYKPEDIVNVKYIFETTSLSLRAQSRTAKLISFGNDAGYDSGINGLGKVYTLYILKKTRIADTLKVKDSLSKFLQKDIQIKIMPIQ